MVGKSHASAHLPPEEITGTHFTVDWMGPRGGLTGYGKISLPPPSWIQSPDRTARSEPVECKYKRKFYLVHIHAMMALILHKNLSNPVIYVIATLFTEQLVAVF